MTFVKTREWTSPDILPLSFYDQILTTDQGISVDDLVFSPWPCLEVLGLTILPFCMIDRSSSNATDRMDWSMDRQIQNRDSQALSWSTNTRKKVGHDEFPTNNLLTLNDSSRSRHGFVTRAQRKGFILKLFSILLMPNILRWSCICPRLSRCRRTIWLITSADMLVHLCFSGQHQLHLFSIEQFYFQKKGISFSVHIRFFVCFFLIGKVGMRVSIS